MKRHVLGLILCVGLAAWLGGICEASTIRISQPKIELDVEPGVSYSGELGIENPDAEEIKIRIYNEDWEYTAGGTGEKRFSPAGTLPLSASKWITFSPADTTLPPYGKGVVRYTLKVPEDAKGAFYSVLFLETLLGTSQDEEGVSVLVAGRVGALFFVRVKGTTDRKGELKSVKVQAPEGSKPLQIETTFKNTGNVDITLAGNLLLMDTEGKVLGRGDLNKIYTLPGGLETRVSQWVGRLPKGKHDLLLTYDLGEGKTLVKDETVVIP